MVHYGTGHRSKIPLQKFKGLSQGLSWYTNWYRSLGGGSFRSNRDECVTAMKHLHHPCGLASVMQATSRRQRHADSAKRTCCRKPAVLGENLRSSAAHNQRKSSTTVVKQLSKVITSFGSKKAQSSDPVTASAHGMEGPDALREQFDAPSNSLLRSYQDLKQ